MNQSFKVRNIKCGGCAQTIKEGVEAMVEVSAVAVDVDSGRVLVTGDDLDRGTIEAKLTELGYPLA